MQNAYHRSTYAERTVACPACGQPHRSRSDQPCPDCRRAESARHRERAAAKRTERSCERCGSPFESVRSSICPRCRVADRAVPEPELSVEEVERQLAIGDARAWRFAPPVFQDPEPQRVLHAEDIAELMRSLPARPGRPCLVVGRLHDGRLFFARLTMAGGEAHLARSMETLRRLVPAQDWASMHEHARQQHQESAS